MLTLARGLIARPKVLLLDEPSLGLAPKLVEIVFEFIPKIREQGNRGRARRAECSACARWSATARS